MQKKIPIKNLEKILVWQANQNSLNVLVIKIKQDVL